MNHTTKSIATLDASAAPLARCWTLWLGRSEGQGPVRPMAVVVINEDAKDMLELLWVEDQEPVKTLRPNRPYEPLRHSVCLRCTKRRANDLNPIGSEHPVKAVGEFLVPVANQEANGQRQAFIMTSKKALDSIISGIASIEARLSGDDSPLANPWEEIKDQLQDEMSVYWPGNVETMRQFVSGFVADLSGDDLVELSTALR